MTESRDAGWRWSASMSGWRPRGVFGWLLTLMALAGAAITIGVAYCMLAPVRWNGPGKLGAIALFFPLHLLVGALIGLSLALIATQFRMRLATWTFGASVLLTTAMALIPVGASWRQAQALGVPLSLDTYLANARRVNMGLPQPGRSVTYGTSGDGTTLELDVWSTGLPHTGPLRPAMLVVHGGAWTHGNRSMLPDWNRWLNQLGYEVFDVEYRMPPPVRWLDEIGDVKAALGWLAEHAAEYHVDPTRISLMGGSAGGNLSMLAAYTLGDPHLPPSTHVPAVRVRTVVNFYGPTDMVSLYRTCESPDYVRPLMERYIGGPPDAFPDRYLMLSPITHVTADAPPTITLTGTSDRLVSPAHAEALDAALTRAGVPHETYLLRANDHGFDSNWGGFGTQIARAKIQDFLARYDGPAR